MTPGAWDPEGCPDRGGGVSTGKVHAAAGRSRREHHGEGRARGLDADPRHQAARGGQHREARRASPRPWAPCRRARGEGGPPTRRSTRSRRVPGSMNVTVEATATVSGSGATSVATSAASGAATANSPTSTSRDSRNMPGRSAGSAEATIVGPVTPHPKATMTLASSATDWVDRHARPRRRPRHGDDHRDRDDRGPEVQDQRQPEACRPEDPPTDTGPEPDDRGLSTRGCSRHHPSSAAGARARPTPWPQRTRRATIRSGSACGAR